ncbi:MAG: beta-ketoacyl-ACP synthase III [Dehalococcoidia bacterium]
MRQAVRISGVGSYLPERRLTNAELAQMVDTSDEWIVDRSGIHERRIAASDESSSTMGAEAARCALASAELEPADIDIVIAGTCTPDGMFPATATRIQDALGVTDAAAFDVNAACNGFLVALSTASQFVSTGSARRALVIGTETMSRIVDWTDRTTCVLFGDGAGAIVLESAPDGEPGAVESFLLRSDGKHAGLLYANGPATPNPNGDVLQSMIVMDGRNIFRQAVTAMSGAAQQAISDAGLTVDDIALCIPHQANIRILNATARNVGLPEDRVYINLDRYGNTSSATIPIALAEAAAEGRLSPGDHLLLVAFGGGLSWGAMVIEWSGISRLDPAPIAELRPTATSG